MKTFKPINQLFLTANDELATLLTRSRVLQRYTHELRKLLPATFADHVHVAQLNEEQLVITADTSGWAAKLRFMAPQLLEQFKQVTAIPTLNSIEIKLLPGNSSRPATRTATMQLNQENSVLIQSLADSVEDPSLAQALHRLAQHKNDKAEN